MDPGQMEVSCPGNGRMDPEKMRMGEKIERVRKFFKDFFVGMAYWEIEQTAIREKVPRQRLFLLLTFGDLLGVPLFSPYGSLRILPYVFPFIDSWKKGMLRERDRTEIKAF
jgi:hypothetical protein